ncbi:DUF1616 domain-containing protein [Haloarcula sp. JP-L23]|uniref:DUF1616 domain-containing protein n=1 Tax=Haloarcula sp. JP-L23 TaxID=2716717 RepID=UPI00140F3BC4|nr:DUF1616 domain-containing protein [Haloarcula sp. JP-L23]
MGDSQVDSDEDIGFLTEGALRVANGIHELPADLTIVLAAVFSTNLFVLLPVVRETPLRILFGVGFLLFFPGYAFVAALFPAVGTGSAESEPADVPATGLRNSSSGANASNRIDGIERLSLSFGLSIVISPLVGVVMDYLSWTLSLVPILLSLSAFTLASVAVAAYRRQSLPETERFQVPYREWVESARTKFGQPTHHGERIITAVLVVSLIVAVSTVGWAVTFPQEGESFTEFYLLTESETGELVPEDYPTEYSVGEERRLIVAVSNQEHRRVEYSVLVRLQNVRVENNSTTVLRSKRLDEFHRTLAPNETWRHHHTIAPTFEGTHLRLQYLLYRGGVPSNPNAESAYRDVHLWVNVTSN